jgi:hypothetical protein
LAQRRLADQPESRASGRFPSGWTVPAVTLGSRRKRCFQGLFRDCPGRAVNLPGSTFTLA